MTTNENVNITTTANILKHRYFKYLDTLCHSNNIDTATLKTKGQNYERLNLFFGGLPVLVGLKYFTNLQVLKLFSQDILSLKPLIDVANTLNELWICEGPLKVIIFYVK